MGFRVKDVNRGVDKDRKSTRLNSSHANISYAVFCLKKKKRKKILFVTKRTSEGRVALQMGINSNQLISVILPADVTSVVGHIDACTTVLRIFVTTC